MAAGNTKEPEMYSGDILQRIYLNPPQSQWLLAGECIFFIGLRCAVILLTLQDIFH